MLNKSAKGWRKELLCRKQLEKEGWTILFKSVRTRFGTIDFGLFDIVAVKSEITLAEHKVTWLYVSNKHYNGYHNTHQNAIRAFAEEFGHEEAQYALWLWHKPKWVGRGLKRHWQLAKWEIIPIEDLPTIKP